MNGSPKADKILQASSHGEDLYGEYFDSQYGQKNEGETSHE